MIENLVARRLGTLSTSGVIPKFMIYIILLLTLRYTWFERTYKVSYYLLTPLNIFWDETKFVWIDSIFINVWRMFHYYK